MIYAVLGKVEIIRRVGIEWGWMGEAIRDRHLFGLGYERLQSKKGG